MQIVIDIPEEYYKELHKSVYVQSRGYGKSFFVPLIMAVQNGIPLPKGHGRLIDADKFRMYCYQKNFEYRISDRELANINVFLNLSQTIIPAEEVIE